MRMIMIRGEIEEQDIYTNSILRLTSCFMCHICICSLPIKNSKYPHIYEEKKIKETCLYYVGPFNQTLNHFFKIEYS